MSSKRVRLISLTGIILIMLIIGASVLVNLLSKDTLEIPMPVTSSSGSATDSAGASADNALDYVSVTTETVQDVIATMKRPVSYSQHVRIESLSTTGSAVYEIDTAVRANATALKINDDGINEHVIITGDRLYIWYDGDTMPYERPIDASGNEKKSPDEYQKILSYEDVLALDKSSITAADYMEHNGENCIYVEYFTSLLHYTTKCYISLETGLLTSAEQYDETTLIYTMTSSDFNPAEPDTSVFNLPDGRNPVNDP